MRTDPKPPISFSLLILAVGLTLVSCRGTDPLVGKWGAGTPNYLEFMNDGHARASDMNLNWRRTGPTEIILSSNDPSSPSHSDIKGYFDVSNDHETLFFSSLTKDEASKDEKNRISLKAFHGSTDEWNRSNKKFTPQAIKERIELKVNADQICDAIRIYSSDNDETWPGQPNDLNPYLHGQTIDPGFRITSPGVKLRGVTDTSTWECAVVEGSVWKVLVYADFHTKLVEK